MAVKKTKKTKKTGIKVERHNATQSDYDFYGEINELYKQRGTVDPLIDRNFSEVEQGMGLRRASYAAYKAKINYLTGTGTAKQAIRAMEKVDDRERLVDRQYDFMYKNYLESKRPRTKKR